MRKFTQLNKMSILGLFMLMTMSSAFFPPDKVRFSAMLIKKADIDKLMADKEFSYMVLQNWNRGKKDVKRQTFELIAYAFTNKNRMIAPFTPLQLLTSVPDSTYAKDVYFENYTVTKASIQEVLKPTTEYSFLRFQPFEDKSDPILANYVSYMIYQVGPDGISTPLKSKGQKPVKIKMNPSPPR